MKAALISLGSVSSKWTLEAMRRYFDEVDELDLKLFEVILGKSKDNVLYSGKPVGEYDCIYAKGSFRYSQILRALTASLCKNAFMPIKASAFTSGHDKLLTQLKLEQHRIPTPPTYISSTVDAAKRILEKVNYPIVMKFPEGTQGKGVMFAESYSSAVSLLDALTALRQPFLIQEYVETGGVDIRAFVVGNKVVAAMKRKAVRGDIRANIHAGGTGEATVLSSELQKIAVNTAKAMGCSICGVDILEGVKGPLVIEVNLSPGLQGITKMTGVNVADKIAKFLFEETKKIREGEKLEQADQIMKELETSEEPSIRELISNLEFRGKRILLPEVVTKAAKISDEDEVTISVSKGKIEIKKFPQDAKSNE